MTTSDDAGGLLIYILWNRRTNITSPNIIDINILLMFSVYVVSISRQEVGSLLCGCPSGFLILGIRWGFS